MLLGRTKFAIFGFVTSMLLTTPLSRLPQKRDRVVVGLLMLVLSAFVSVWPFLAPAFNQRELAALVTKMDSDGVGFQTTGYTCGACCGRDGAAPAGLQRLTKAGSPSSHIALHSQAHRPTSSPTRFKAATAATASSVSIADSGTLPNSRTPDSPSPS